MGSKAMNPRHESFFPTFFYRTQFKSHRPPLPSNINLTSQTAIITGANAGLGLESCRQLLALNLSHLILAVRTPSKGETAAATLRKQFPEAKIEVWQLDMCSYASVQAFAEKVEKEALRVDIVVLNAGIVKAKYTPAPETGHEESMQVNYLSTVLLALLLLPILRSKRDTSQPPARLTIVNSGLSLTGKFPLNPKKPTEPILKSFDDASAFSPTTWYNASKTLMHLFLWKVTDYISADDVVVNIVDPGYVKGTEAVANQPFLTAMGAKAFAAMTGRTVQEGASTYVDAVAVQGRESHGCFLTSWKAYPFADFLYEPQGKRLIEKLWEETMVELDFAKPLAILEGMKAREVQQ